MFRTLLRLIVPALLAVASVVSAETLQELTAEALRKNPELQVFEQSIAAAKGKVTSARTFSNPELSVAPGVKHTIDAGTTADEFHGDFAVSQLFKFPGKRALEIAVAQRNVEVSKLARESFRFQVMAKVRRAFYELLAAQKITALRNEQVGSAQTFVESSRKRAESGYASDFETIKSQAELIAAQRGLVDSQGKVGAAQVTLNSLLGRAPSAPVAVEGALEGAAPRPFPRANYVTLAMAQNPSLRTLNVQAEAARLNLRATRFGRRPDFAIGPQLEYTRNEQIYGLGVTVALPFWDQKRGDIQTATAEQQKTLAEIEKTRREIEAAVTMTTKNLELAQNERALYTPAFLDRLKTLVGQAEQSYAQSATTLLIYLDAKRTYFDALSSYYESLCNVAGQRAELESAVGVPLELNP